MAPEHDRKRRHRGTRRGVETVQKELPAKVNFIDKVKSRHRPPALVLREQEDKACVQNRRRSITTVDFSQ
jgi:hypothetical protein